MCETDFQEWLKDQMFPLDDELEHYGIKGQKWGVRRTPEELGRVRPFAIKAKRMLDQARRDRVKKKSKKKTEKQDKEPDEKVREKLLKSTDPKYLYKYRSLLSTKELQERLDRIEKEAKLKKLTVDKKAKKAMKEGEETLKSIASMAESMSKVATAINSISKVTSSKNSSSSTKSQKESDGRSDNKSNAQEKKSPKENSSQQSRNEKQLSSIFDMMATANEIAGQKDYERRKLSGSNSDEKSKVDNFEEKKRRGDNR